MGLAPIAWSLKHKILNIGQWYNIKFLKAWNDYHYKASPQWFRNIFKVKCFMVLNLITLPFNLPNGGSDWVTDASNDQSSWWRIVIRYALPDFKVFLDGIHWMESLQRWVNSWKIAIALLFFSMSILNERQKTTHELGIIIYFILLTSSLPHTK